MSTAASAPTTALTRWRLLGALLALLLYVLDQLTKWWVSASLVEGERLTVVPGLLWWHYVRNPGAAFSLGESVTWVFTLVMLVVAVVVLRFLPRAGTRGWVLALCGLLAGVCGNLTDRLLRAPGFARGHVVDFIAVPHFAIFNLADSCICVSIAGMVLLTLRGVSLDGAGAPGGHGPGADDAGEPHRTDSEENL